MKDNVKREQISDDPRYKIANREALIGIGIAIANFLWWFGFAYGFGSKDVDKYHYVFGFPAWFFYSCILGFIVFTILVIIIVQFFYKDIPLDAEYEDDTKGGSPK